ncbi:MAG: hypothetical protein EAX96_02170 [Candidatus Lokiarchaeota archaeon]|nr:hypothetical protein [Candidatus Lokiarchaeota archaeon]
MSKKILIVGSGIGGSGIGALISKETPHQVYCFEKNLIIGGRCGSYKKTDDKNREWIFDVGCHIFSTCDKGPLGEILSRCGKEIKWSYTQDPGPRVNVMGMELSGMTKTKKKKSKEDTTKKKESFTDFVKNVSIEEATKYDQMRLTELLDEFYGKGKGAMNRIVYSMQAGVMFGTSPEETSAGEFLRCVGDNARQMSMGYPIGGGTGIIPETYWQIMKENRGSLFLGKDGRVSKIIVEDNVVKGVEAGPDNQFFEGDMIIANSDIKTTVLKLIGEKYFDKDYVEYIKNLKWGGQVCSLKIAIDTIVTDQKMLTYVPKMEQEEMGAFFMGSGSDMNMSNIDYEAMGVPTKTALLVVPISNHDPALAPKGCQNIHTVSMTAFGKITRWSKEDEKKWEKTCLDSLLTLHPEIEDHIVIQEFIANSVLEARFGKEGAGTGTAQNIDQVGKKRPSMTSPIKGLYFCSGDAGGWGIGTELPARAVLELFDILKKNNFQ